MHLTDSFLLLIQTGVTALMLAAGEGHVEVVMKLVELGVDVAAADIVSHWYHNWHEYWYRMCGTFIKIDFGSVDNF